MEDKKYPIGRFVVPHVISEEQKNVWIRDIAAAPGRLKEAVKDFSQEQLDTPYREGGWTVRQVVHHLADSHMNAFIRFKLSLTEDFPTIKPYSEGDWALLPDSSSAYIEASLKLLEGLHTRWEVLLNSMTMEDFKRKFIHPELQTTLDLYTTLALYSWHSRHHTAHITSLKQ
ncbi:putative damage-inducible protein DinB [Peribacillus deserti]|uniref:Putative metal-dependent hydrolase JOC77_002141 n=1 Tax=Peribacillus deserti TaxID=673318 RepID=A0ABS2QIB8_9BACI|nr:bacillithiol transferase BstA [Peribacillus deserti]MBM7692710.1 putative damage-inducible protein DinB [Peribacillus deserti]